LGGEARELDWKVVCASEANLWHKGVQRDYNPTPNVTYYGTRNWFLYLAKHRAPAQVWTYAIWRTGLTLLSWTVRPRWRSMREHRDAKLQGVSDFLTKRWGMRGGFR